MSSVGKKDQLRTRLARSDAITLAGVLKVLLDAIHAAELAELRARGAALTVVGSMLQIWPHGFMSNAADCSDT
jgi:hypothetical protein